jgi:hypothetical protein
MYQFKTATRFSTFVLCSVALMSTQLTSHLAHASNILLNSSFETGVAYSGGPNIFAAGTPAPWSATNLTPDCYDNTGADGWNLAGVPAYGGIFKGMLANSGNRFLGFAAGFANGSSFNESFAQSTPPLAGGQTYTVSAFLAADDTGKATSTFGGPYSGRGEVKVFLNSNFIGTLTQNTASLTWQPRSFTFVAPTATTAVFNFVASPDPTNLHPSYIGVDDFQISVPEPATCLTSIIGCIGLAVLRRHAARSRTR